MTTRTRKLLIGAATIWPLFYIMAFSLFMVTSILSAGPGQDPNIFNYFAVIFPLHMLTIFGTFGLIAYYIANLFKNTSMSQGKKVLWAICLVKLNMFAMPIYWYQHIWKGDDADTAVVKPNASASYQAAPLSAARPDDAYSVGDDAAYVPAYSPPAELSQSELDMEEFDRRLAEAPAVAQQRR